MIRQTQRHCMTVKTGPVHKHTADDKINDLSNKVAEGGFSYSDLSNLKFV